MNKPIIIIVLFAFFAGLYPSDVIAAPNKTRASKIDVYGGATFDPQGTFEAKTDYHLSEVDGLLYFIWHQKGTGGTFEQYKPANIYVSIAKSGKWIVRGKKIYTYQDLYEDPEFIYIDNNIMLSDKTGIHQIKILTNGNIKEQKIIEAGDYTSYSFREVYTNNSYGFMINQINDSAYKVYLAKDLFSKPTIINNSNEYLEFPGNGHFVYLNENMNQLYLFDRYSGVSFYDIKADDMVYDKNGDIKKVPSIIEPSLMLNSKFVAISNTGFRVYDQNLKKISEDVYKTGYADWGVDARTLTPTEYHIWTIGDYKHTKKLTLEIFKR
ncbi:MAG: hypothetical protein K6T94_24925 [Paenibacillus sp.]|nr:hypothetical protein [Paenibacillus sp.]